MKSLNFIMAVLCLILSGKVIAQGSFESRAKEIAKNIGDITKEETENLKAELETINKKLENNTISSAEAAKMKEEASKKSAQKIEERVAPESEKLAALVQEKVDGKIEEGKKKDFDFDFDWKKNKKEKKYKGESRTTSQFVFAFGKNGLIEDKVWSEDYQVSNSRFYELGLSWNTRILNNNNLLHLKYGLSFMFNNLRPNDNKYFVEDGNRTGLAVFPAALDKKPFFRTTQLVAPVHLEFDFTRSRKDGDKITFKTHKSVRVGIGAYAGFNIRTRQILEFKDVNNNRVEQTIKGDYNTTDFIYGLSSYVGYQGVSLYAKYDLNPLFQKNTIDQNNISVGLRFDLN